MDRSFLLDTVRHTRRNIKFIVILQETFLKIIKPEKAARQFATLPKHYSSCHIVVRCFVGKSTLYQIGYLEKNEAKGA